MGKLGFDDADRRQILDEAVGELVIAGHVLLGEMEGLGEETVAGGVEGRALFALGGFRARGTLGMRRLARSLASETDLGAG